MTRVIGCYYWGKGSRNCLRHLIVWIWCYLAAVLHRYENKQLHLDRNLFSFTWTTSMFPKNCSTGKMWLLSSSTKIPGSTRVWEPQTSVWSIFASVELLVRQCVKTLEFSLPRCSFPRRASLEIFLPGGILTFSFSFALAFSSPSPWNGLFGKRLSSPPTPAICRALLAFKISDADLCTKRRRILLFSARCKYKTNMKY